jgi:hypothetical protein
MRAYSLPGRSSPRRFLVTSALAAGCAATLSCRDSSMVVDPSAHGERGAESSLPVYARQLRGDAFLAAVTARLERPEIASQIDHAIGELDHDVSRDRVRWSAELASTRRSLASRPSADSSTAVTEADVLSAMVDLTLARLQGTLAENSGAMPDDVPADVAPVPAEPTSVSIQR